MEGGGGVYFEAPRGKNFICPPPPFIHTPPLGGYFQGWGGVYKIRPRNIDHILGGHRLDEQSGLRRIEADFDNVQNGRGRSGGPTSGRAPKSLCSALALRELEKVLAVLAFCEMLSHSTDSLLFRGSAGVTEGVNSSLCDSNPPRPFARYYR